VVITSGCPGDVAAAIVERCPAGGVLGVELGQEQRLGIALADLLALQDLLGQRHGVRVADAAPALWAARMIKSAAEIARLRAACAITDQAYQRAYGWRADRPTPLRPGMTERARCWPRKARRVAGSGWSAGEASMAAWTA